MGSRLRDRDVVAPVVENRFDRCVRTSSGPDPAYPTGDPVDYLGAGEFVIGALRNLSRTAVKGLGPGLSAIIFGVLTVAVISPIVAGRSTFAKALAALASGASLGLMVFLIDHLLLTAWARPILGEWCYKSTSENCGHAKVSVVADEIRYKVNFYKRPADLVAVLDGQPGAASRCFGHACSRFVTFSGGRVDLVYTITGADPDYPLREGMLTVSPNMRGSAMKGFWKSDIEGGDPRRGSLTSTVQTEFRQMHEKSAKV